MIQPSVLTAGDLLGDCEILTLLGRGGMGEVYLARDRRLGRKVAVKVLPASFSSDAARLARFEREARSASALNHPNLCTIHALGELPDGRRFIVMEHVDGVTLRAMPREPLDLGRVVDIGRQLAEGLAAAHETGVVHRDVKPENVMVRADGFVKILDFGLAKVLPESSLAGGVSTHTADASSAGAIVGTVQYMSPEQARGQPADARTDIWAVGAVLYELVTGHPAFGGSTASDIVANVLHAEPPPLGRFAHDCPPELQRIVSKCLRKDRGHRYQTVRDVALDLEALGDTLRGGRPSEPVVEPATTQPDERRASSPPPAPAPVRRQRRWLVVSGVLLAAAIVSGVVAWQDARRKTREPAANGSKPLALKRLTFDAGLQTDVSFSPDGRFIAYASDRSGNFDIWVQPVDGGDPVQITKEPAQDVQPAWSPDGQSIAFRSERGGGGIFVMPALGGHARQLSTFGSHPSWLDQSEILFLLGNPEAGVASIQLFLVPVDGATPREVLRDFALEGGLFWAAGHPDGRISVLADNRKRGFGLFTLSRDGRSVTASSIPASLPIRQQPLDSTTPTRFQWNRSGTALYLEASIAGIQNLWRVAVDSHSLAWQNMERLTTGPGRDIAASLSGDGRRLAYTTATGQARVYVQALSADGTTLTGNSEPVTEPGAEVFTSALSNDGRRLAYLMRRVHPIRFARALCLAPHGQCRDARTEQPRGVDDGHDDRQHLDARRRRTERAGRRIALSCLCYLLTTPVAEVAVSRCPIVADRAARPRHTFLVRVTHWIAAASVAVLVLSGIAILLAHPRLYWGETGALGGPSLVDLPLPFVLEVNIRGPGRYLHFLAAWIIVFTGLLYVAAGLRNRHFVRAVLPRPGQATWREMMEVVRRHLRFARPSPGDLASYNVLQRASYTLVLFVLAPLMIWTGLAMSPTVTSVVPVLVAVVGGQQSARTIHFAGTCALVLFTLVHVAAVLQSGFRARMRGMIIGTGLDGEAAGKDAS